MAAPDENLLSLGHLTVKGQDTFTKHREPAGRNSTRDLPFKIALLENQRRLKVMNLQQRLRELKERESVVQQQNRQLLQQFDASQGALRDILASNAAMKRIRSEYGRSLQESGVDWQQQVNETRSAHEKKMKYHLRPYLDNYHMSGDQPFSFQGFRNTAAPQFHSAYSQECSSQLQPGGPPIRSHHQSFSSSQVPTTLLHPSTFPHFPPFPGYNRPSVPSQQDPRSIPDPLTSLQAEHLLSQITGQVGIFSASESFMGDLNKEPTTERRISSTIREDEMNTASRSGGSLSNILSQELDIKPSRLSSDHVDSSGSSGHSGSSRSKKKGGKPRRSSERRSSQAASTNPSLASAPVAAGQSSDSDAPSHQGRSSSSAQTTRGLACRPGETEKMEPQGKESIKENSASPGEESQKVEVDVTESREKSSNVGNEYHEDESQSSAEASGSQEGEEEESRRDTLKIADEVEKQETSSSGEEENVKDNQRAGNVHEDEEDSQEEDEKLEGDDEGTGAEDGKNAQGDDNDPENKNISSVSSPNQVADQDVPAGSEEEQEEEESKEEKETSSEEGGSEERDSEDSIISPQEKRPKQMNVIPEEEEEESPDSDTEGFSDDDIENLLAPQEQRNEEENSQKSGEKPTGIDKTFQVELEKKSEGQSDSDEFDHFYD